MSVKEIERLSSKLRNKGLMFPEFKELCELLRKRDENNTAATYWEM